MRDETVKYRLSLYESQELIKETSACRIETVFCTLDDKFYIMRTYPDDKRGIFRALVGVQNAHIPKIVEVIFNDNTVVIEEYIQGEKLNSIIESKLITRKQANAWAKEIFEALKTLHAENIIHRDIKPDNMIIDKNGCLFLIDFGIARFFDKTASHDTQHLGTIGYAPPEQFGFSQSDFRSDLYAAGVTIEEICRKAGCPSRSILMRVAQKCQELAPNRRYPSANAALRDIRVKRWQLNTIAITLLLSFVATTFIFQTAERRITPPDIEYEPQMSSEIRIDEFASDDKQDSSSAFSDESGNNDIDADEMDWKSIIAVSALDSAKEIPYIPILSDTGLTTERIGLANDRPETETEIQYNLKNGVLELTLSSYVSSEQKTFTYQYPSIEQFADTDKVVEAEIMFYDMDGDSQYELLITLSYRKRFTLPEGYIFEDTSGIVIWCVGYSEDDGFWQADGMVGPSARLTLGNGILIDGMTNEILYLNNRTWIRQ